ncbi:MAG: hypothetical protein ACXVCY_16875 [Pseudobdellovibrionaceae bacterium]
MGESVPCEISRDYECGCSSASLIMQLQFVREIPIRIVIEASSGRRGFLFYLAAGFFKELDPLTGMSADLVLVDGWLENLKKDLEQSSFKTSSESFNSSFAELMAVSRLNLIEAAEKHGVFLKSLSFREARGWSFSWISSQAPEEIIFSQTLYVESFSKLAIDPNGEVDLVELDKDRYKDKSYRFELLRLTFNWVRLQNCDADFHHESVKLLKGCHVKNAEDLHKNLKALIGIRVPSGSFLKSVEVNHLDENFGVIL